jgi:hypothetical protein
VKKWKEKYVPFRETTQRKLLDLLSYGPSVFPVIFSVRRALVSRREWVSKLNRLYSNPRNEEVAYTSLPSDLFPFPFILR